MIGGILANIRFSGTLTQTVWVVPGLNLRFIVDISFSRFSQVPGGGDVGITDLKFGKIGEASASGIRMNSRINSTVIANSIILTSGDSVIATVHNEDVGGAFQITRTVNIWILGREVFKSDFFETR